MPFIGGYVRWRPRMVHQSVLGDLKTVLDAVGWYSLSSPTTIPSAVAGLLTSPIVIQDAFPEEGVYVGNAPAPNTLTMDMGLPGTMEDSEMGGLFEQPYKFSFAFFAESDAVAKALLSDLSDRYLGMTDSPFITLHNYAVDPVTDIVRMEVESFAYAPSPNAVAPGEHHLYYAELIITDYLDQVRG